ncbi:MAG: DUF2277 domain-containing protein [Candidatus Thorarchaeota archaeon]
MCRNIRPLFNFDPPATNEEIMNASKQFVRKITGFSKPSKQNEEYFNNAIKNISEIVVNLLSSLVTSTPPKNREIEVEKSRQKFLKQKNALLNKK